MVDYSLVLTGLGLIVAITYYALTLRNATKTRQAQLFMQIYNNWNNLSESAEILNKYKWTDYSSFMKLITDNADFALAHRKIVRFYEGLGMLVRRDLVDVTYVADLMTTYTIQFWEKHLSIIDEWRSLSGPEVFEQTEYVYSRIKKLHTERHPDPKT